MYEQRPVFKLKRSQGFFGIHFDFHAKEQYEGIGQTVTEEMIRKVIRQVHPDFLQCDCKGHPGLSSYPTKVGNAAPGIQKDALRLWRKATQEAGVALVMHYSGVWDTEAIRKHPDWAREDETGKRDPAITSVFGPYADELLIPQLKELSDEYGVDGVWVDGDCWATRMDYSQNALDQFRQTTGIMDVPRKPEEPYYQEFLEFCRDGFRRYLRHYVDEIHRHNPSFEIASNWAYTSFMPERVDAHVDFCSGDLTLQNAVNSARLEGRCLAHQGKPWDLMSWGFSSKFPEDCSFSHKPAVQLMQEAAAVIALGGGYQAYYNQRIDGSIKLWQVETMAELAGFCRARQPYCHGAQPVPQIALLFSSASFYRALPFPFDTSSISGSKTKISLVGVLLSLLDSQHSVQVLMEHNLKEELHQYPLVIVPECETLEDDMKQQLVEYARAGGSLLVMGAHATRQFKQELNVTFSKESKPSGIRHLSVGGRIAGLMTALSKVKPQAGTCEFGRIFEEADFSEQYDVAATITAIGKGKIAGVYFDFGERYLHGATTVAREFMDGLVRQLYQPAVEVRGSNLVDVCVNRIAGKLAVNLVNVAGPHANKEIYTFDEIPPVGPLEITIQVPQRPRSIVLQPDNEPLPFTYENGIAKLVLSKLSIHEIIMVEGVL